MEERIFEILFKEDEITWQSLLYDLVKQEGMDPFDIDVSIISHKYIDRIKKLRETDLRMSGKVVLAAAILLKIKSNHLIDGLNDFNDFLAGRDEDVDIADETQTVLDEVGRPQISPLMPRTPQPRARKVSLNELIDALNQFLEVKRKRILEEMPEVKVEMEMPERKYDIIELMKGIHGKITSILKSGKELKFHHLVSDSATKEDKVLTFMPLLHLSTQRKVDLEQKDHFGDIWIKLVENKE